MEKILEVINAIVNLLHEIAAFIDGYKTYIAGVALLVTGLVKWNMETILASLAVLAMGQKIDKVGKAVIVK